jgi:hypothetical protein
MGLSILDQIRPGERFRATFSRRERSTTPRAGEWRCTRKERTHLMLTGYETAGAVVMGEVFARCQRGDVGVVRPHG